MNDDDDWEEKTMVVEVNGVLDAHMFRTAVSKGQVNLRKCNDIAPILQVCKFYWFNWLHKLLSFGLRALGFFLLEMTMPRLM